MQEILQELLTKEGFSSTEQQLSQFARYYDMLMDWNSRMNLTAIEDKRDVAVKHFVDSVLLIKVFPQLAGKRLIDVGTGAGFPGVPLKIMEPQLEVCLFDSLQKRIGFLDELIGALKLEGIWAQHGRSEDFGKKKEYREQFDIATARAVAKLPTLLEYCLPFVKPGGYFIALKGPEIEQELAQSAYALRELGGELVKVEKMELDGGNYQRNFVMVKKMRPTEKKYPRKAGTPQKNPLI